MEKAGAFISGKQELFLSVYWNAFQTAVSIQKEEKESKVRGALVRMLDRLLGAAFGTWRNAATQAKEERRLAEERAQEEARRAKEGADGNAASVANALLATTQSLSAAVDELRQAGTARPVAAGKDLAPPPTIPYPSHPPRAILPCSRCV